MPAAAATLPGIFIEWRVRHADALSQQLGEICRWAKSKQPTERTGQRKSQQSTVKSQQKRKLASLMHNFQTPLNFMLSVCRCVFGPGQVQLKMKNFPTHSVNCVEWTIRKEKDRTGQERKPSPKAKQNRLQPIPKTQTQCVLH